VHLVGFICEIIQGCRSTKHKKVTVSYAHIVEVGELCDKYAGRKIPTVF